MIVDITTALTARLEAFTASAPLTAGAVPTAWPGVPFTKPASGVWFEVRLFNTGASGFIAGSTAIRSGYMQVSCVTRKGGAALFSVSTLAQQVADHFPNAAIYSSNNQAVQIMRPPEMADVIDDDGELRIPVVIWWQAMN